MYKMVTIDVDDTLLNDDHIITAGTREALADAIRQGVIVTLATGRMYASAKNIARQLELNVPLITYQGSLVKNLLDEAILYERSVPASVAEKLLQYCEEKGLHLQFYADDTLYSREDNHWVRDYSNMSKVDYTIETDFRKLLDKSLTKLLIFDEPQVLDRIAEELNGLLGDEVHMTKSKPFYLEILHPEGTKGHAVRFLAQHYGCELAEVIAIGDSWNDHEMLKVAGLGVAMENAVESLKEIADYITLSNNDEGVKHVIDKFILNRM